MLMTFRKQRSLQTFENLLKVIGEEKREQVVSDEAKICILVKAGTKTLNGDFYYIILPFD